MSESENLLDIRTNCPYCRIDINSEDHNQEECLHNAYKMMIEANARISELNQRLDSHGIRALDGTPAVQVRTRRQIFNDYRYVVGDIIRSILDVFFILAVIRFIFYGIN